MYTNKLIGEKSPYLQQHAHNPVDWHPWGEQTFTKARRENKPVFLSIGYSTCHWCHVMARESFESEEVAALLNRWFVPVKVDREERPDVDRIYMGFVTAITGSGGWPLSVWLTPEGKPFYGGTYYPPVDSQGRPGFVTILRRLAEAWEKDRDQITTSSEQIAEQLQRQISLPAADGTPPEAELLDSAFQLFRRGHDREYGGFGGAPKFPRPVSFNFLLRYGARTGMTEAVEMVSHTLHKMAAGGIRDQLGGGFHRYSVDERWFVPHFEKMLYDQAQLAVSYLEAYQVTREDFFAGVARQTLDYVLREMRHPDGAFYSAEDADSVIDAAAGPRRGEGSYYTWTHAEIARVLGEADSGPFCYCYGVEPGGNVEEDPAGEFAGRNILYQAHSVEETAERFGAATSEVAAALEQARAALLAARSRRRRPHRDEKILTAWNALMISALAFGGRVLGEARYLEAAREAAEFLLARMYEPASGRLWRRHCDGETAIPAFLDDYAFLIQALVDLYEASFDRRYLEAAAALAERERELFEDSGQGGFFVTTGDDPSLVMRLKDDYDGAEPSGNAAAALGLLRLAGMTGRGEFRQAAERTLQAFAPLARAAPPGVPQMLVALGFATSPPKQILLAGEASSEDTEALLREFWRRFLPYRILLLVDEATREKFGDALPEIRQMKPIDGRAAAYVCENYTCRSPARSAREFAALLE